MMMRCVPCEGEGDEACANCGKLGSNAVKLKNCTACRLVKYCGVDCQRAHRKLHKKACKQRVAELKDEQLYSQGLERPEGDFCPICTLPIPLPMGNNGTDTLAKIQARVLKKDPTAMSFLGEQFFFGSLGLQKEMQRAIKLWTEAAELGSINALFRLGDVYNEGNGVQQDKAKAAQFWSKAAMQGHARAPEHDGEVAEEGRLVPGLVGMARGVARPVLPGVAARHGEDVAHLAPGRGTNGVSSGACPGFELGLAGLRALPDRGGGVRYGAGVVAQAAREVVEDLS
ncbi:hypothetical protein THAOC_26007, partial [Thalassiosira oceanica]